MILPSILHFLNPFLAHDRSKTLNLRCSIWNGCLRSWAYVLMFLRHCRVPYSLMKRSGMNIDISLVSGSWSVDLSGSVVSMCCESGEDAADRMRTCCFSLGRSVGETHQRQHLRNALSDLSAPTKWCFSTFRNTMRCSRICHKQKKISHTIPNDPSPCLNDSSGKQSANTLVTGKKNKQTHPSTWSNLLQLSLPSGRTKFSLTSQREQGELSP